MSRAGRLLRAGTVVASLALLAGGCGSSAPPPSGPSGVDGLVVPTPDPDPADFVAGIDNPWLALEPGSVREYDVGTGSPPPPSPTVGQSWGQTVLIDRSARTVAVDPEPVEVAGVETTVVRSVTTDGADERTVEVVDYLAQDSDGNVWWFGSDDEAAGTSWRAGTDGALAGLYMPAVPRTGDGFRQALAPGIVEDVAEVASTRARTVAGSGELGGLVHLVVSSPLAQEEVSRYYAKGVGLVSEESPTGLVELSDGP